MLKEHKVSCKISSFNALHRLMISVSRTHHLRATFTHPNGGDSRLGFYFLSLICERFTSNINQIIIAEPRRTYHKHFMLSRE